MRFYKTVAPVLLWAIVAVPQSLPAQTFSVPWHSIDNGGGMTAGPGVVLTGTIGQFDAGPTMSGGAFAVIGGFEFSTTSPVILGDVNGDGEVNLLDVAPFVNAVTAGTYTPEADVNGDGEVNLLDVAPFVDLLTGG